MSMAGPSHSRFRRARARRSDNRSATGNQSKEEGMKISMAGPSYSRFRRARPGGATTGQLPAISAETPFHGPGWSGRRKGCPS